MVTDRQVERLLGLLSSGMSLRSAALRSGMSERTARRYRALGRLPREVKTAHSWRTRQDPFEEVWDEVVELLQVNPQLQGTTLFDWLTRKHPGRFEEGQLRTLQRRVKQWRAMEGPAKEVFFSQVHRPGDLCASDFTHMSRLDVTIGGQPFDHMVYHFVLTYSNWEAISICYSESFESLSAGLQSALWKLGGVAARHRTDRLSAAVNNLSDHHDFTARYQALMDHYGMAMEKTQPRSAHENGDVESSHDGFKTAVDQALMLRGSREFADEQAYRRFLEETVDARNAGRRQRLAEEQALLRRLPSHRLEGYRTLSVRVSKGSLIQVLGNTYSVHSRLIGEKVTVRVYADHVEVWYAQRRMEQMVRLRGRGKHQVNYRHIIDWLVRKAGAFENYRYREDLFPTSRFRMAYDALCERGGGRSAVKEYLELLRLAAYESQSRVDEALRVVLSEEQAWTAETVRQWVQGAAEAPKVTDVEIEAVDLSVFDSLLEDVSHFDDKEVFDDGYGRETDAHGSASRVATAGVS